REQAMKLVEESRIAMSEARAESTRDREELAGAQQRVAALERDLQEMAQRASAFEARLTDERMQAQAQAIQSAELIAARDAERTELSASLVATRERLADVEGRLAAAEAAVAQAAARASEATERSEQLRAEA